MNALPIMRARFRLYMAAASVFRDPAYIRRDGKTFCNLAAAKVATLLGYPALNGMLSSDQHALARASDSFLPIDPFTAAKLAGFGVLVLAFWSAPPDGHVVVILPGAPVWSDKWGAVSPLCMDIGANHTIGRCTAWAFHEQPEYFALKRTLPWAI